MRCKLIAISLCTAISHVNDSEHNNDDKKYAVIFVVFDGNIVNDNVYHNNNK